MNKIWWLWIPLIFMVFQIILEISLPPHTLAFLHGEQGPHEMLQVFSIVAAFVMALKGFMALDKKAYKWLAVWIGTAAICCFYVAGEELSWAQHLMKWNTPEYWAAINDQQETNLHNTSSWLDQKPRILLEIGVVVGGLLIPFLLKYKPALVPARFTIIYPPAILAVVAIMAVFVKLADTVADAFHFVIFERGSEVEELYLYYFVFLYLLVMKNRIQESFKK